MKIMLLLLLLLPLCSAAPLGGDKPGIYDAVEELRKRLDTIEAYLKENSNSRDGRDLNGDELNILNNIAPAIGILKSCGKDGDDDDTCNAAQIQNVSEDIGITFERIREGKSVSLYLQKHFDRLKMEIDAAIEMAEEEITDELAGMGEIEVAKFVDGTCYADDHYRFLLPDRILYSATNTPDECIETCASRGYSYAGVQYAHECFCGNQEPPASRIRESSQCRMKCPGDSRFYCGGDWRMNIYAVIKSGTCDASNWPDLDHGLTCGDCKALIDGMDTKYLTCDNYCESIGRSCSGAWEETGDSCEVKSTETCTHRFTYTSDAICKCGPLSGTCDASNWPDLDHGLTCGDCKALIDFMDTKYITCDNYCESIGRSCSGAWEETGDSCKVKSKETCAHRFTYTSDAICKCGKLDLSDCPANHFSCLSGECIPQKGRCNGLKDCSDGSDERNCQDYVCPSDRFKCNPSGKCISGDWECDGEEDCNDGSDESHCQDYVCPADRFECSSGDQCIKGHWRCDGEEDCRDGSDEGHCEDYVCPADRFECSSGECIPLDRRCDGEEDCKDGSDEDHCEDHVCPADRFECSSGKCIPLDRRCDGEEDCNDGSDESHCEDHVCPADRFECSSGECIPLDRRCDGEEDCNDGSDEDHCEDLEQCIDMCESLSCQNDRDIRNGCNQMYSCAQGCKLRQLGLPEGACRDHCDRHGGSGCYPNVRGFQFELCHGCDRDGCGEMQVEECEQGCNFYANAGCIVEDGVVITEGNDAPNGQNLETSGQAECSAKCYSNPDCVAWTMIVPDNLCWLKTVYEGHTSLLDGWISGTKECGKNTGSLPSICSADDAQFYPDPVDCTKYYQCSVGLAPARMSCSEGTRWSSKLGTCDLAANVHCQGCEDRFCPANWSPVCGADGETYSNLCSACGVDIACEGECPCSGVLGNGERACEGHGYGEVACASIGCCHFDDGQCWSSVGQRPCWTSGGCFEDDTAYPGNDINPSTAETTDATNSPLECQGLCKLTEGCQYFTWRNNGCWLKTHGGEGVAEQSPGAVSGFKICGNGEEVCEGRGFNEEVCNAKGCCRFDDGQCRSSVGQRPCGTSGDCFEDNTAYPGNDLNPSAAKTDDARPSPLECQALCKQTQDCQYFTWRENECWLKTKGGVGLAEQSVGAVSGFKICGNGEEACEGHGYNEDECNAIGCCRFQDEKCWSAVGQQPCSLNNRCYEEDTDYPGSDINLSTGANEDKRSSPEECQELCTQREGCKFFTWKDSTECWLKTKGGPGLGNDQEGSVSGPRFCGNGEEVCEGHGYNEDQCAAKGCCHFQDEQCLSSVGQQPCRTTTDKGMKDMCTGYYQEDAEKSGNGKARPQPLTKCVSFDGEVCHHKQGRWGSSFCYIDDSGSNWGAECVSCPGNGEEVCEGHNYEEEDCAAKGCCTFYDGKCWSSVGQQPCRTDTDIGLKGKGAEGVCEGHGYGKDECLAKGCCTFYDDKCWSAVGQQPCKIKGNGGEGVCEGHGYDKEECIAKGCCQFTDGQCWSSVGQQPCRPNTDFDEVLKCQGKTECCTKDNPCEENDGHCTKDSECEGELVCGTENCAWENGKSGDNCCKDPGLYKGRFTRSSRRILSKYKLMNKRLVRDKTAEPSTETIGWGQIFLCGILGCSEDFLLVDYYENGDKINNPVMKVYVAKEVLSPPDEFRTSGYHGFLNFGFLYFGDQNQAIFFVLLPKEWHPFQKRFKTNSFTTFFNNGIGYVGAAGATLGAGAALAAGAKAGGVIGSIVPGAGTLVGGLIGAAAGFAFYALSPTIFGDYLRYIG